MFPLSASDLSKVSNPAYENVRMLNNNCEREGARSVSPQLAKMATFGESRQSSTSSESSRYSNPMPSKVMNPVYELQSKRQRRLSSDDGSVTSLGSSGSKVVNPIYEQTIASKAINPVYAELKPRTSTPLESTETATSPPTQPTTDIVNSVFRGQRPRSAGTEDNRPPITAPKPVLKMNKPGTRPNSVWSKPEKRFSSGATKSENRMSIESTKSENRMSLDSVHSENRMSTGSSVSENRMSSGSDSSQTFNLGAGVNPGLGVDPGSGVNPVLSSIPVMEGNAKVMNLAQLKVNGQSRSSDSLESTDSSGSTQKVTTEPAPIPTPRQKVCE